MPILPHSSLPTHYLRFSTSMSTPEPKPASLIGLPAELRLQIYNQTARALRSPFHDYAGLYLTCRQIRNEMDYELCTQAAAVYQILGLNLPDGMKIHWKSGAASYHELTGVNVWIPRWALYPGSTDRLMEMLCFLRTITVFHFHTLTVRIQDAPESAIDPAQQDYDIHVNNFPSSKYRVRTTYSDITPLISTISCCIRAGLHHALFNFPYWCHCNICPNRSCHSWSPHVNVRTIIFVVKKLDEEMRSQPTHWARWPPYNPLQERGSLRRQGWIIDLSSYSGPKSTLAHARPRQIIWTRRTVGWRETVLSLGNRLLQFCW
jgi:hypothetical protein